MRTQDDPADNHALTAMSGGVLNDVENLLLHSINHICDQANS